LQLPQEDKAAEERERGWNSDLIALLPGTSGKRNAKPIKADFTPTPCKLYVGSNNVAADSHRAMENGKQQGSGAFTSRGNKRFLRRMEKIIRWYLAIIFTGFSKFVNALRTNVV